jgi:hypothetical protein
MDFEHHACLCNMLTGRQMALIGIVYLLSGSRLYVAYIYTKVQWDLEEGESALTCQDKLGLLVSAMFIPMVTHIMGSSNQLSKRVSGLIYLRHKLGSRDACFIWDPAIKQSSPRKLGSKRAYLIFGRFRSFCFQEVKNRKNLQISLEAMGEAMISMHISFKFKISAVTKWKKNNENVPLERGAN